MTENPDLFDAWIGNETPFVTAIGQFVMRFAALEYQINEAIRELLRLEAGPGAVLTSAIQSFSLRLDILEALLDGLKVQPETEAILRKGVAAARELNGIRNSLLHDHWTGISLSSDDEAAFKKKRYVKESSKGRKKGMPPFKPQDLNFSQSQVRAFAVRCWNEGRALNPALKALNAERVETKERRDYVLKCEPGVFAVTVEGKEDR